MPHSRAKREIFLHFYTDVLLLFVCIYTYVCKAIKRNNVQSVSLGTGNYRFLFGKSRRVTQLPTQNSTSPPQHSWGQLYYLLFLIPTSLISFLFVYTPSFFESQTSFMVFSYTLIYKCPCQLSSCTTPLSVIPWTSVHLPTSLVDAQGMFSLPGASLNSRAKSLILNVLHLSCLYYQTLPDILLVINNNNNPDN